MSVQLEDVLLLRWRPWRRCQRAVSDALASGGPSARVSFMKCKGHGVTFTKCAKSMWKSTYLRLPTEIEIWETSCTKENASLKQKTQSSTAIDGTQIHKINIKEIRLKLKLCSRSFPEGQSPVWIEDETTTPWPSFYFPPFPILIMSVQLSSQQTCSVSNINESRLYYACILLYYPISLLCWQVQFISFR